jgi:hypothetical protein
MTAKGRRSKPLSVKRAPKAGFDSSCPWVEDPVVGWCPTCLQVGLLTAEYSSVRSAVVIPAKAGTQYAPRCLNQSHATPALKRNRRRNRIDHDRCACDP